MSNLRELDSWDRVLETSYGFEDRGSLSMHRERMRW